MSFSFAAKEMRDDLIALSRVGSDFFENGTVQRIERLAKDLDLAIADAKSKGKDSFSWSTVHDEHLLIKPSTQWKGATGNYGALSAEVKVDYQCFVREDERLLVEGATVVRILDPTKLEEEKLFHFDVEAGGWHEMVDGVLQGRAGHPALHMQFYGMINDLPRLPSLIVHPVDVISLVLLELHQAKWREHLAHTRTKSLLRKIPGRQRNRLSAIIAGWQQRFDNPDYLPIVAMQTPFREPLAL